LASEIVHNDDIASAKGRHKDSLDIGSKALAIWSLEKPRCVDPIEAELA